MRTELGTSADATAGYHELEPRGAPGRRTLTMGLPARGEPAAAVQRHADGSAPAPVDAGYLRDLLDAAVRPDLHDVPVQRRAAAGGDGRGDDDRVHQAADHGISGSAGPLPHLDAIQQAFGRHSVDHVQAHTDGAAAAGARAMGADAFATGDHVAFAGTPDLHTAAHEAAHVVQQAAGVHLAGGVGQVGDPYERHADAVADRVVRGESAEVLLDEMAGRNAGPTRNVQRVHWKGWEERLDEVQKGVASKAKLGMAIVEWLAGCGVVGRIGGSLAAAMFGGTREPRDIDIDVANNNADSAKRMFLKNTSMGMLASTGKDLFFLTNGKVVSKLCELDFCHVVSDQEFDLDEDEDVNKAKKLVTEKGETGTAKVDFSGEEEFSKDIVFDDKHSDIGYAQRDLLVASYLNRYVANHPETKIEDEKDEKEEKGEKEVMGEKDEKNDRGQVVSLLARQIKCLEKPPEDESEAQKILQTIKLELLTTRLSKSNERVERISVMFDELIVPDVVKALGLNKL